MRRRLGGTLALFLLTVGGCVVGTPKHERKLEAPKPMLDAGTPTRRAIGGRAEPVRQSGADVVRVGYSVEGRPIVMHRFGAWARPVLIFGGFHGDEPTSVYVAERLIALLKEHAGLANQVGVAIVPNVNPDGRARNSRRNSRRVDINRNFATSDWERSDADRWMHGGPAPLSEPESQIVMELVERLRPRAIISIHSIRRGRHCNNHDGPAESLAEVMAAENGYPVAASIGYRTPGSFGTWAGRELQIPTVTLELPAQDSGEECWERNREALIAALRHTSLPAPSS